MNAQTPTPESPKKRTIFTRRVPARFLFIAGGFILFWPLALMVMSMINGMYSGLDETQFPDIDASLTETLKGASEDTPNNEKGVILSQAIYHQLEREMNSSFGWSVNDILPTRWLDNRNSRQKGVIFATRMLERFFSTRLSKYGAMGVENEDLKNAREKRLVYSEDIWGFFHSSTESEYETGINLIKKYEKDLQQNAAVFNLRTDDMYDLLTYITSREFLDQPMGLLIQPGENVSFSEWDDNVYYAQGAMLVVRDFMRALVALYPWIVQKGGAENLQEAFTAMNRICSFDPIVIWEGSHDSMLADHRGKIARYYVTVITRMNDVAQSISR
jgi:hypothetical protein